MLFWRKYHSRNRGGWRSVSFYIITGWLWWLTPYIYGHITSVSRSIHHHTTGRLSSLSDIAQGLTRSKPSRVSELQMVFYALWFVWSVTLLCCFRCSSLRSEFVPTLVSQQFSATEPKTKSKLIESWIVSKKCKKYFKMTIEMLLKIINFIMYMAELNQTKLSMDLVTSFSSWTDHSGDLDGPYHDASIRCYAHHTDARFCIRANTIPDYYEANKQVSP